MERMGPLVDYVLGYHQPIAQSKANVCERPLFFMTAASMPIASAVAILQGIRSLRTPDHPASFTRTCSVLTLCQIGRHVINNSCVVLRAQAIGWIYDPHTWNPLNAVYHSKGYPSRFHEIADAALKVLTNGYFRAERGDDESEEFEEVVKPMPAPAQAQEPVSVPNFQKRYYSIIAGIACAASLYGSFKAFSNLLSAPSSTKELALASLVAFVSTQAFASASRVFIAASYGKCCAPSIKKYLLPQEITGATEEITDKKTRRAKNKTSFKTPYIITHQAAKITNQALGATYAIGCQVLTKEVVLASMIVFLKADTFSSTRHALKAALTRN